MANLIDIARNLLSVLFILVVAVDGRTITTASTKAIINASVPASKNMPAASDIVTGLSELKIYFHRYGYLPDTNFTDVFDGEFESAVTLYQSKLGLPMTGRLDSATLSQVMSPRCRVPDHNDDHNQLRHTTKHYSLITGRPTWNHSKLPFILTYALFPKHIIHYIKLSDVRVALEQAFSRWSSVIPVNFIETQDYMHANITIGFYYGDHRDGIPFDDRMLAVASGPRSGAYLHFNAAHTWAVDFNPEKSKSAYDLETTAVHEIGHLLGLNHTSISEAIMWPYIDARTKHVNLALDDVNGAQALYDANPKFKLDPPEGKEVVACLLLLV